MINLGFYWKRQCCCTLLLEYWQRANTNYFYLQVPLDLPWHSPSFACTKDKFIPFFFTKEHAQLSIEYLSWGDIICAPTTSHYWSIRSHLFFPLCPTKVKTLMRAYDWEKSAHTQTWPAVSDEGAGPGAWCALFVVKRVWIASKGVAVVL